MSDPIRLINGDADTLEVALLRSARRETLPARVREGLLAASVASTAILTTKQVFCAVTTANVKSVPSMTALFVAKWALVGTVGGLATAVALRQLPGFGAHPAHDAPALSSVAPVPESRVFKQTASPVAESVPTAQAIEPSQPMRAANNEAPSAPRQARPNGVVRSSSGSSLATEIALIDKARTAAAEQDPARAVALVDAYQRQFPNGSLLPEAQWLRIEALLRSGQRAQALPIAQRLLKAAPDGSLAERIRASFPELMNEGVDSLIK